MLYLMVMYSMTESYQNVFKMIESCASDELTPEGVRMSYYCCLESYNSHYVSHAPQSSDVCVSVISPISLIFWVTTITQMPTPADRSYLW